MKKDDHLGLILFAQLTLQRGPIRKQHDFFMLMTISSSCFVFLYLCLLLLSVRLSVCHMRAL